MWNLAVIAECVLLLAFICRRASFTWPALGMFLSVACLRDVLGWWAYACDFPHLYWWNYYAIELLRQEEQQGAVAKPRFGRAVDWILMVLDSDGRAMTEEEVVQRAMDEGFALGEGSDEYRKGRLTRSLSMYDTGVAGKRKQVLRRKGGRIGRVEWTDDRFEQN